MCINKRRLYHGWVDLCGTRSWRASLLAEYRESGLRQKDLARCTGLTQGRVDQLLRYARFLIFLPTVVGKITEGRFRTYWRGEADKEALRMLRGKKNAVGREAYEQDVTPASASETPAGPFPGRWAGFWGLFDTPCACGVQIFYVEELTHWHCIGCSPKGQQAWAKTLK